MELWVVKTAFEIPDELFPAAKAKAALDGRKLKDLVEEGLRVVVADGGARNSHHVIFPLITVKKEN